jgi:hypothetical protein
MKFGYVVCSCKDGRDVPVPNVKVTVSAAAAVPKYTVTIGGTTQLVREERDVSHGTAVFRDLVILILPESSLVTCSSIVYCAIFKLFLTWYYM